MAESVSLIQSRRIEWKVRNIFSVDRLESEAFDLHGTSCKFILMKTEKEQWECIQIFFTAVDAVQNLLLKFSSCLFIEDRTRSPLFPVEYDRFISRLSIWSKFAEELREKRGLFLMNDVTTFVCIFLCEIPENGIERGLSTNANSETVASLESLSVDVYRLLDTGVLSDVTLQCGDYSIPTHKLILSARSEVFQAMLRSDMAESRTGVVEISDMEPSVLDQLVEYIYCGDVSDMTLESAEQLYVAADKYAIASLKGLCGSFMKDSLTEENACNVLVLAETYKDEDIKSHVLSFIMQTELLRDDECWLSFHEEHPKLAVDVLHLVYKQKCFPE